MAENESRLERAAESTMAKVAARFFVPAMLVIISFFLRDALGELKEQGQAIVAIQSDVRVLQVRLDAQVLRQVQINTDNIEKLDGRLQRIERRLGD